MTLLTVRVEDLCTPPLADELIVEVLVVEIPELRGDANGDGVVGVGDYTRWADNFGTSGLAGHAAGDFNNDGLIGVGDYTTWADNFGATLAAASEAESAASSFGDAQLEALAIAMAEEIRFGVISEPIGALDVQVLATLSDPPEDDDEDEQDTWHARYLAADLDGDGALTSQDVKAWKPLFLRGDPRADLNRDGVVDSRDLRLLESLVRDQPA